MKVVSFYIL
uniref:Uncharacterized protein n=1 Tax=Arundo donax TaxID=35708 RepID=A0A0A9Q7U2_ARUDO